MPLAIRGGSVSKGMAFLFVVMPAASSPHRPIIWLNVVIGLLAGIVLALTYAFLADHFDHSVKGIGDVETHVGVPVLASIPRIRRRIIRAR